MKQNLRRNLNRKRRLRRRERNRARTWLLFIPPPAPVPDFGIKLAPRAEQGGQPLNPWIAPCVPGGHWRRLLDEDLRRANVIDPALLRRFERPSSYAAALANFRQTAAALRRTADRAACALRGFFGLMRRTFNRPATKQRRFRRPARPNPWLVV